MEILRKYYAITINRAIDRAVDQAIGIAMSECRRKLQQVRVADLVDVAWATWGGFALPCLGQPGNVSDQTRRDLKG
ncbi:MAG: hypothetical protein L0H15_09190 [Nitrosospira sp.]|nr:hypothetical protein [Nitrosospira sp.]